MELIDILALAAVWVVAFVLGWTAREKYALRLMDRILDQTHDTIQQRIEELKKDFIHIEIEKHQDQYFVYNMEDKTFMAQGTSQKSLEEALTSKYPGKKFAAKEDNLIEMGFVNASDSK